MRRKELRNKTGRAGQRPSGRGVGRQRSSEECSLTRLRINRSSVRGGRRAQNERIRSKNSSSRMTIMRQPVNWYARCLGLPNSLPHRTEISIVQEASQSSTSNNRVRHENRRAKVITVESDAKKKMRILGVGGGEIARFGDLNEWSCRFWGGRWDEANLAEAFKVDTAIAGKPTAGTVTVTRLRANKQSKFAHPDPTKARSKLWSWSCCGFPRIIVLVRNKNAANI